ncbi:proteasome subunit beta type-2 [Encephalitozoon hellem ATCC 50504]|uniref:Proteasome subunit beta n=1 Tax=Encephalitozoon hellem TaxID=27973 RepID=A0A9Q9C905_ENCHE|nr:proteasome subunit beta type-2 [Encephalitozoon hellem ATCC 50504]AFM98725.1 proteasome subunit beta type-2 [Encephalitozoon hellem ATCC 50504]UTX43700.1 proteasome subunit beta type-4 [Encephalitozoon hellem]WEL39176.1 proteasome subunit beta type-4 [Encephalitozoon hellem]|eukprot:XP_003887706.1 proteasome subunit beta type-2 [Encephalitozoon hellem ATCC 50504]
MDSSIGIKGSNFAVVAADTRVSRSFLIIKENYDKFHTIKDKIVMSIVGDQGDAFRTILSVSESAQYEEIQNGIELSPSVLAHMVQSKVHESLRKRQLDTSTIIAGKGPQGYDLWSVDKYGAISSVPFCASGYAAYFVYGILDREYSEDITVDDALRIIQKCINLLKERLVIGLEGFMVKVVTDEGVLTKTLAPEIKD